jgi:hypothetical protein
MMLAPLASRGCLIGSSFGTCMLSSVGQSPNATLNFRVRVTCSAYTLAPAFGVAALAAMLLLAVSVCLNGSQGFQRDGPHPACTWPAGSCSAGSDEAPVGLHTVLLGWAYGGRVRTKAAPGREVLCLRCWKGEVQFKSQIFPMMPLPTAMLKCFWSGRPASSQHTHAKYHRAGCGP